MPTSVQLRRRALTTQTPTGILSGELQLNQADGQIWYGDNQALPNAKPALAVRFFSATATYATGDLVIQAGAIYRALSTVTPAAFSAASWARIAGLTLPADAIGSLTNDGAGNLSYVAAVPLTGATMTGLLTLSADPTQNFHATTKQYADAKVAKSGSTMTGALVLSGNPTIALHAATKQYADAVGGGTNTGRNRVMNSRFIFNQRGQGSVTGNVAPFVADRWQHADNNAGTRTLAINGAGDADRSGTGDEEMTNYLTINTTGSAGVNDFEFVCQRIESVNTLAGKTVTLSFWATATAAGKFVSTELVQNFGTGGSPSPVNSTIGTTKHALTTGWARYSVTFTVPSISGKTKGSNGDDNLQLTFWTSGGSTYNARHGTLGQQTSVVSIWGVQLEEGSVATTLEKKNNRHDLADCQRYYQTVRLDLFAYAIATALVGVTAMLPVPMRIAPTAVGNATYGNASGLVLSPSNIALLYYCTVTAQGQVQLGGSATLSADY